MGWILKFSVLCFYRIFMFQFNTLATCFECFELENLEETWMENEKRKKKVDFSKEEFFRDIPISVSNLIF